MDAMQAPDPEARILVVDDIPQNLVAMTALLARPGVRVLQARSGTEALEALLLDEVAVALVDVQMPLMDGFELAELIRGSERTKHTPLIFLTASASDPGRTFRGYEAGAVDFLHKPVDPQVLRSKVDVFIELQRQKHELARRLAQLEDALRTNEIFIAVLGHDLRNPLGAILNGAELVSRLASDERLRKAAELMRSSGQRMSRMIEQLLDVARIRAGRIEMKPVESDLRVVTEAVIAELQAPGGQGRVTLATTGQTRAAFDPDRVGAAISNLVANALQHGEGGPVQVRIDGSDPAMLRLWVSNAGVIPPEKLATLLEPFHTSGPSSGTGLGLGLYIVHEFVAAHGGELVARSSAAEGTVMEVRLPRAVAAARAKAAAP
jgi:two-component system, sensor histidine kinase and response regulator